MLQFGARGREQPGYARTEECFDIHVEVEMGNSEKTKGVLTESDDRSTGLAQH